jgi:hypothetical protein
MDCATLPLPRVCRADSVAGFCWCAPSSGVRVPTVWKTGRKNCRHAAHNWGHHAVESLGVSLFKGGQVILCFEGAWPTIIYQKLESVKKKNMVGVNLPDQKELLWLGGSLPAIGGGPSLACVECWFVRGAYLAMALEYFGSYSCLVMYFFR